MLNEHESFEYHLPGFTFQKLENWPPDGVTGIGCKLDYHVVLCHQKNCKFGHQMAPAGKVVKLATRWSPIISLAHFEFHFFEVQFELYQADIDSGTSEH